MTACAQARIWHSLGVATIPIVPRGKAPALQSWKQYQSRLPGRKRLGAWFGNGRPANLAVITGWQGLVVADMDDPMQHSRWLAGLPTDRALAVMRTYAVRTRRGRHYYFYCGEDADTHPAVRPGIDIKANGSYVLAPPSIHPSGCHYAPRRTPADIACIPDLRWLGLEPEQSGLQSRGLEPPSLADVAMQETCNVTVAELKRHYNPAALLGLSPGRRHKINCPLPGHQDTHASFTLYRDGHYHCYGCGAHGGDAIDLYAAVNGLDLRTAMRQMAKEKGL